MPATLTSTRIGADTNRAVLNQFQQDPARLWTMQESTGRSHEHGLR